MKNELIVTLNFITSTEIHIYNNNLGLLPQNLITAILTSCSKHGHDTVNEMKSGKAPGLDGFPVEYLNKGGMALLEWLVRLLNLSFDMGVVPIDWRGACIYSASVQREG